ncbi:hypothetical protein COO60DRAFT_1269840 [Scenedesmus sp. NREL 46B-D3]|nr:hypothetical protein COO60DRAFT_1269840 [Scenedesmus sp. NREL 46B-D3]
MLAPLTGTPDGPDWQAPLATPPDDTGSSSTSSSSSSDGPADAAAAAAVAAPSAGSAPPAEASPRASDPSLEEPLPEVFPAELLDASRYGAAPSCLFPPSAGNSLSDAQGRLWGWMRGTSCLFRAPDSATAAAAAAAAAAAPQLAWDTAPVCEGAANGETALMDGRGQLWGWQGGASCSWRGVRPAAVRRGQLPIEMLPTLWEHAPACLAEPLVEGTLPDAFGRLWGEEGGGSCAFKVRGPLPERRLLLMRRCSRCSDVGGGGEAKASPLPSCTAVGAGADIACVGHEVHQRVVAELEVQAGGVAHAPFTALHCCRRAARGSGHHPRQQQPAAAHQLTPCCPLFPPVPVHADLSEAWHARQLQHQCDEDAPAQQQQAAAAAAAAAHRRKAVMT